MTAPFEIDWYAVGAVVAFMLAIIYILFIREDDFSRYQRTPPPCFGSDPGPQEQAENCCDDCPFQRECSDWSARKDWDAQARYDDDAYFILTGDK